jgi:hypothetical protein
MTRPMSISVSVPSCCRRRSSAVNVTASPFRSNVWDRRRPPCRQRTRHRTAPFFRTRRSISTPALPGSSSLSPRMPPPPDGRPPSRSSSPRTPRRTLAQSHGRSPGAAGLSGNEVCNRITHFVTHFPTHPRPVRRSLRPVRAPPRPAGPTGIWSDAPVSGGRRASTMSRNAALDRTPPPVNLTS